MSFTIFFSQGFTNSKSTLFFEFVIRIGPLYFYLFTWMTSLSLTTQAHRFNDSLLLLCIDSLLKILAH